MRFDFSPPGFFCAQTSARSLVILTTSEHGAAQDANPCPRRRVLVFVALILLVSQPPERSLTCPSFPHAVGTDQDLAPAACSPWNSHALQNPITLTIFGGYHQTQKGSSAFPLLSNLPPKPPLPPSYRALLCRRTRLARPDVELSATSKRPWLRAKGVASVTPMQCLRLTTDECTVPMYAADQNYIAQRTSGWSRTRRLCGRLSEAGCLADEISRSPGAVAFAPATYSEPSGYTRS